MAGRKPWSELRKQLSPEQLAQSGERAKEIKLGMLITEMRKHSGMTQEQLAERIGVSQPRLSALEAADDMHVETLKRIVAELGGRVVVHLPGGDITLDAAAR